jgi:multicomponent K+:H+ antiporter subunit E
MKAWLPSPFTSALLFLFWLMLNQSVEAAHLLLAAILAIVIPVLCAPLMEPVGFPVLKRPWVLFRLLSMALVEIVRSCFNVSRIILLTKATGINSQFIRIPLDLRSPYGLALLSCLINSTPGTVWAEILQEQHELVLHVFDLHDEQWWIDTVKTRYEQPLIEIFE